MVDGLILQLNDRFVCVCAPSGVREKHHDWEALLEKALAEECSAPANLLELVRH